MGLAAELEQFLAAVRIAAADSRWTTDEIDEVIREGIDCLAPLIDALDKDNPDAVQELVNDALSAAIKAINALPDGRFLSRQAASAGARIAIPWLIEAAAKSGQPAHDWIQLNVTPRIARWEGILHRLVVALGGK